jgi:predicted anti-sigma-YlaC factor YlaD
VTCQEMADFLFDYRHGDLSPAQRMVFDEHLGKCPNCVAYLQSYEMTIMLTKSTRDDGIKRSHLGVPEEMIRAILDARKRSA